MIFSNNLLISFFEKSNEGLIILHNDIIHYCNPRAKEIMNIRDIDPLGRSIYQFSTNKKIVNGFEVDFDKIVFDDIVNKTNCSFEWEFLSGGNIKVFVSIDITNVSDGKVEFKLITIKDISSRKQIDLMLNARMALLQFSARCSTLELYNKTLEEIILLTESDKGYYFVFDYQRNIMNIEACYSNGRIQPVDGIHEIKRQKGNQPLIDQLQDTQVPIIKNKIDKNESGDQFLLWNSFIDNELLIPISRHDAIVAFVAVANKHGDYSLQDGELAKYLADLIWDIIEQKSTEEKYLNSQEKLFTAQKIARLGYWEYDLIKNKFTVSAILKDLYDIADEVAFKKLSFEDFIDYVHPDDIEYYSNHFVNIYEKEVESSFSYRIITSKGEIRYILSKYKKIFDEKGELIKVMGTSQDITQRKLVEISLQYSEEKFNKAFHENSQAMILATIDEFRIIEANDMALEITGFTLQEVVGKTDRELRIPLDNEKREKILNSALKKDQKNLNFRFRKKNGTVIFVNLSISKIRILNEHYFLLSFSDVTQEFEAEQKLIKAYNEITSLKNQLEKENLLLRQEIGKSNTFSEIVTQNKQFRQVLSQVEVVAPTDASVLIFGETGTGKELIARAIHQKSKRKDKPLVKLNCAAIPESLIESELFGHEKGAFTGAYQQKIGRFEVANGGTLFLDEIGEMPVDLQSKLLRVLQEGEFERIGGSRTLKVNVRIIAATNRDLYREIETGNFRRDLFYRLNVFPVTVPPLRERIDDISLLAWHFINQFNLKHKKQINQIPAKVMIDLVNYDWPGNVRELENLIERSIILSPGNTLGLAQWISSGNGVNKEFVSFEEMQRAYIEKVLLHTNWKISGKNGATGILDLKYSTLTSKMNKLGIKKP